MYLVFVVLPKPFSLSAKDWPSPTTVASLAAWRVSGVIYWVVSYSSDDSALETKGQIENSTITITLQSILYFQYQLFSTHLLSGSFCCSLTNWRSCSNSWTWSFNSGLEELVSSWEDSSDWRSFCRSSNNSSCSERGRPSSLGNPSTKEGWACKNK